MNSLSYSSFHAMHGISLSAVAILMRIHWRLSLQTD